MLRRLRDVSRHQSLDDVDRRIIEQLVLDPRISYTHLADTTGLSATATKARVDWLREKGLVSIRARVDPAVVGLGVFAFAFIDPPGSAIAAAKELADVAETAFVVVVAGAAGVMVEFRCRDWNHLNDAVDRCRSLRPARSFRVATLVEYIKQDWSAVAGGQAIPSASVDAPTAERPAVIEMDEIDRDLLRVVAQNGRVSYADAGKLIGLSPGAVRNRFHRLTDAGALTVQSVVSPGITGLSGYVVVGVKVEGPVTDVARKIAAFDEVALVATVFGAFDVALEAGYRDSHHLAGLLDALRSIGGVRAVESFPYLIEVKMCLEVGL